MIDRLHHIWKSTSRHLAELTLVYVVQFVCYSIASISTLLIINKYIGQSSTLERLAAGFDRTVLMDVIYRNDGVFDGTKIMLVCVLIFYLLTSIVLHGGLLHNISQQKSSVKTMLRKGVEYFFPFLAISTISILLLASIFGGILLLFSSWVGDPLTTFDSERPFVWWLIGLMVLFTFLLLYIWAWMICAKYAYIADRSFLSALRLSAMIIWKKFRQIFALGYLMVGVQVLIAWMAFILLKDRGADGWTLVILGLVARQLIAYLRVWIRGAAYTTLSHIYSDTIHQNQGNRIINFRNM